MYQNNFVAHYTAHLYCIVWLLDQVPTRTVYNRKMEYHNIKNLMVLLISRIFLFYYSYILYENLYIILFLIIVKLKKSRDCFKKSGFGWIIAKIQQRLHLPGYFYRGEMPRGDLVFIFLVLFSLGRQKVEKINLYRIK